jgi:hypothetical protein
MNSGFDQTQFSGFTIFGASAFLWFQTAQLETIPKNVRRLRFREGVEHKLSGHQSLLDAELEFSISGPEAFGIDWTARIGNDPQEIHFNTGFRIQPEVLKTSASLEFERFSKFDLGDWRGRQGSTRQAGNQQREENSQNDFHASSLNPEPSWSVNFL